MTATQAPNPRRNLTRRDPIRRPGERAGKRTAKARPLFDPAITRRAIVDAFRKLNPAAEARNPVMFVVWVGSILATLIFFRDLRSSTAAENVFAGLTAAVPVVHRAVRQLRRGDGGGAGQGPGRQPPRAPAARRSPGSAGTARSSRCPSSALAVGDRVRRRGRAR